MQEDEQHEDDDIDYQCEECYDIVREIHIYEEILMCDSCYNILVDKRERGGV